MAALRTAAVHCRPGGRVAVLPDFTREVFDPGTYHGGRDGADGRGLRYLEWAWDPDASDHTYLVDYAFVLRTPDGSVTVEHDRHEDGLFARADWLRWFAEAEIPATCQADRFGRDVFVGIRTARPLSPGGNRAKHPSLPSPRRRLGSTSERRFAMRLASLLLIAGLLALAFGLGFLLAPGALLPLYGVDPAPGTVLMSRFFGAALIHLGIALYLIREVSETTAQRGLILAGVIGSAAGLAVALMGQLSGVVNAMGWSTLAIYGGLLLAYAGAMRTRTSAV